MPIRLNCLLAVTIFGMTGCTTPALPKATKTDISRARLADHLGISSNELLQIEDLIGRAKEKYAVNFVILPDRSITVSMADEKTAKVGQFYVFRKFGDLWVIVNSNTWRRN
jgi:hypothetical protein